MMKPFDIERPNSVHGNVWGSGTFSVVSHGVGSQHSPVLEFPTPHSCCILYHWTTKFGKVPYMGRGMFLGVRQDQSFLVSLLFGLERPK